MDSSSSSIRPEASTVHRAASTDEKSLYPEQSRTKDSELDNLEGADTVIRQDFFDAMGGSSRRVEDGQRELLGGASISGEKSEEPGRHGSSRSRAETNFDGSEGDRAGGPMHATPASLTRELQGQRLNHFELLEQIGGGGMGAVFRARDERLGRTVAVKVVPFAAGDPDLQRRFRNEAQSAAKLDHPLIARVFEVGNDGPWYYIVFEYIDGSNIRDIVSQDGPLSLDDAVFYTCQVAEAIGHASKRGIVHRDIKPSNVVVTEASSIKLVDMGLARSDNFETSEDMTASGVTLGTFDYISPEQAHDPRLADIRSDLYSLGCTFYFMLTGSPPFPGGTMLQKLLNHGNAAIPDIRDERHDASEDLHAILQKMLAKQPDQRYQDSQALIADLREFALREELPRSSGVDVVAVEVENRLLQVFLSHLPWVVAASVLLASAGWLEILSWQQRSEFSSQLAATVPSSALESLPDRSAGQSPNGETSDAGQQTPSGTAGIVLPQADPLIKPLSGVSSASQGQLPGIPRRDGTFEEATAPKSADSDTTAAASEMTPNDPNGRPKRIADTAPFPGLPSTDQLGSVNAATDSATAAAPGGNMAETGVAADPQKLGSVRLPSDPPSFGGFPFPINSNDNEGKASSQSEGDSVAMGTDLSDRTLAQLMLADATKESSSSEDPAKKATSVKPVLPMIGTSSDPMSNPTTTSPALTPDEMAAPAEVNVIRVVEAASMQDQRLLNQLRTEGIRPTATLREAVELARTSNAERIELSTPLLVSEPIVIEQDDLVIASSVPGGTSVVFRSDNEVDMQRSEMISIGSNRIEFVDTHFYWTVPVTETDGGGLLSMTANRRVRLTDCSITIDNPSRRDEIFAFNVVTQAKLATERTLPGSETTSATTEPTPATLPLVSIEMYNVIVRGEISMLRMDQAAELQLLWENGLLAVSGRMIETGGSVQRPQPRSGSIRLSMQRLTAYTPQGLLQMRLNSNTSYPVEIERRAEESVFVVDPGMPHIEITGTLSEDRDVDWLRLRGSSNAYETDATLSDPLLIVRDVLGQTNTTTMDDLADEIPAWADDRTPRWVVRWSDPLPTSISPSRMIPADFRQDGSLFAGFQERSLPKMPMQRTFDNPPYE
ncbi:serine/threonine protein kinase [Neorhodopirellula pilleata]|uniref:Serine/threonine-protein kinase PknB n=1 Tax=Neorhodopirellula pilleata TaxID=2714738 RepID=A0A5C5ZYL2_9BACT|nr:serine/threonine-protein kinase [Neorhodopirellula pilleata]TWT92210.1 Serine/threonine-protein kinase PknB [Neorhodopirellula pilleata]